VTAFAPADRVGAVVTPDAVYVAPLPDGPILVLEGTAALVWETALGSSREAVAERVAAATAMPIDDIRAEVDGFLERLVAQGLLVVAPAGRY
jgi:hypothetical protein